MRYSAAARRDAMTKALQDGHDLDGLRVDDAETITRLTNWGYLPGKDQARVDKIIEDNDRRVREHRAKVRGEQPHVMSERESAAIDAAEAALAVAEALIRAMRAA